MIKPLFVDPDRLVLGTRREPSSYTDQDIPWGISHTDRRNHLYVVGKTGMGKTALLRNILTFPLCCFDQISCLSPKRTM